MEETRVFPNQISCAAQLVHFVMTAVASFIHLRAEMQSGKSNTFLYAGLQLLLKERIDHIVVFCGSNETSLRKDMFDLCTNPDESEFWMSVEVNALPIGRLQGRNIRKNKIHVVYQQDMQKWISDVSRRPEGKILWIWDECHYGSSNDQLVDAFCEKMHLDMTGNDRFGTQKAGDLIWTVSATDFAGRSNMYHHKQNKKILELQSGEGYVGVRDMMENDSVEFYNPQSQSVLNQTIEHAMESLDGGGIGLIRVTKKTESKIKTFLEETCGIPSKDIIKHWSGRSKIADINEYLDKHCQHYALKDRVKCIIFLKGRERMGHRLKKHDIKFVIETAYDPNADTILQSLFGRMCGYGQDGSDVTKKIFLPENAEKDVSSYKKGDLPTKAKDMMRQYRSKHKRTIPEKLVVDLGTMCDVNSTKIRTHILEKINARQFTTHAVNEPKDLEKLTKESITIGDISLAGIRKKREEHYNYLEKSYLDETIIEKPGTGLGVRADGSEIKAWFPKTLKELDGDSQVTVYLQFLSNYEKQEVAKATSKAITSEPVGN
jgi:hypothetical protein